MEKNNKHSGGGFFLGLIAGVILTLMITTKKGRRILRVLTEEGFDKFSEWDNIVKDVTDALDEDEDDEFVDGEDYVEEKERGREEYDTAEDSRDEDRETREEKPERKPSRSHSSKRLFRGLKKRP